MDKIKSILIITHSCAKSPDFALICLKHPQSQETLRSGGFDFNLQIKSRLETKRDLYNWYFKFYNSKAFLGLLSHNNSNGFSSASLTATRKPTDSRPSMILWSYDNATYIIG